MSKITERRIYAVPSTLLTSNGTNKGELQVADTSDWRVGQVVILTSSTQSNLELKIKRILPDKITMFVGPKNKNIHVRTDISDFLIVDGASLHANEQERPSVPEQEVERATYEEEPVIARRVIIVDKWGDKIDEDNPITTKQKPTSEAVYGNISVTNTATPLRVGASNLSGRSQVVVQPKSSTIYIGFDGSVTAGNNGTGLKVTSNSVMVFLVDDGITLYGISSGGGSVNTFVSEEKT